MERIIGLLDTISKVVVTLSGISMILIVALIVLEVSLRALLSSSTLVADEYSGYLYVTLFFFALAFTMRDEGHIRVGVIFNSVNWKARKVMDLVSSIIALLICTFALYYAARMVSDAYTLCMVSETPAATPIWIPQLVLPLGLSLFILQIVSRIFRISLDLQRGEAA
jgi:TRAP-type transport system small permease protein